MLKDNLMLGGTAGVVGNFVKEAIAWGLYFLKLIPYTFDHFCAGIFIAPQNIYHPAALAVGIITDFFIAALLGIAILGIVRKTGIDYWFMKGFILGVGVFVVCYGILRPFLSPGIIVQSLIANLLFVFPNIFFGFVVCWFIKRFGPYKVSF